MSRGTQGLATMVRLQVRTHGWGIAVWIVGLVGSLVGTAFSIAGLYSTPAEIHSYAVAVEGGALYAINGRVEGIDSLGGVIQDEFGFMAAFLFPLLGISLVARSTRRDEEDGRLEALLARRVDRRAPVVAALLVAAVTIALVVAGSAAGLAAAGVPTVPSIACALSLGALAFVFAGATALLAQVTLHTRNVYGWSLAALLAAYVVRGVGDATGTWLAWLSPLGWQERVAPFAAIRWWALAIPSVVGLAGAVAAVTLAGRRDLGSALVTAERGPDRASAWLRRPIGTAMSIHRTAIAGWTFGAVVLAVTMGALAQQVIDAMTSNPSLADALGASGSSPEDGFYAVVELYLAVIASAFVVQSIGALHREEWSGRVEPRLAQPISRSRLLAGHAVVVGGGLAVIVVAAAACFALAAAWSTGDPGVAWPLFSAALAYLPAEAVVAAGALVLYGWQPRAYPAAWAAVAGLAFIAFLGPGLNLAGWVVDLAPTSHVGNPPLGAVATGGVVALAAVAVGLTAAAFAGFRRRAVPGG